MIEILLQHIINIVVYIAIFWLVSLALNLEYGFTGIPNLGLHLSVMGGAFTVAYLPGRLLMAIYLQDGWEYIQDNARIISLINQKLANDPIMATIIFLITLIVAIMVSIFLGLISVYPAVKLKAVYLMMTLIAMGEVLRTIGTYYTPLAGGPLGILVPNLLINWGRFRIIPILLITITLTILVEMILRSPFGRLIKAIRENEEAAESLGKDVKSVKMKVIILGSVLCSVAGFLYALDMGAVVASSYDRIVWTFWPWLMVMVGGLGNNLGCITGTALIVTLRRILITYKHEFRSFLPFEVIWLESMLLAISLLIIMIFMPQGILPERIKASHSRGLTDLLKSVREKRAENKFSKK
ncbi:MAG: branched-chain amino acid ABC transporter permease [Candidatus Bathyarchaeia archaeon]